MQSTSEVLPGANQNIQNEENWYSNQQNIQVQDFCGKTSYMTMLPKQHLGNTLMGQQRPYVTGGEQQEQWQEYQQQQQQLFLPSQLQQLNSILQQQMQMVLPTEHQQPQHQQLELQQHQQQQHLFPNQIEQFEQQMQIFLPGHEQPQQLQQQEQQFNVENFQQQDYEYPHLRYQEDSQRVLLGNPSRHQQQPVNQHGNQQWQQGGLLSGFTIFILSYYLATFIYFLMLYLGLGFIPMTIKTRPMALFTNPGSP
jgi:hypothetical protein